MHKKLFCLAVVSLICLTATIRYAYAQADSNLTDSANHLQIIPFQNPLPVTAGIWTASEQDSSFADAGVSGQQKIAMVLPKHSTHFELLLTGFNSSIPDNTTVNLSMNFDTGQSMSFTGQSYSNIIQANIPDADVAAWTHNMTADRLMGITFSGISESPWTIPLSGTTPTIAAMATAIKLANITGLPRPWNADADNTENIPLPPKSALSQNAQPTEPVNNDQPANQPNASITDCTGFGNFVFSYAGQYDFIPASIFSEYFHTDIPHESDQNLDALISQAQACVTELYSESNAAGSARDVNQEKEFSSLATMMSDLGVLSIQHIEYLNDQAVQNSIDEQKNASLIQGIPDCGDPNVISGLKNFLANNPDPNLQAISINGMKNITDISGPNYMGSRACQADALLNSGESEIMYTVHWFDQSQGQLAFTFGFVYFKSSN